MHPSLRLLFKSSLRQNARRIRSGLTVNNNNEHHDHRSLFSKNNYEDKTKNVALIEEEQENSSSQSLLLKSKRIAEKRGEKLKNSEIDVFLKEFFFEKKNNPTHSQDDLNNESITNPTSSTTTNKRNTSINNDDSIHLNLEEIRMMNEEKLINLNNQSHHLKSRNFLSENMDTTSNKFTNYDLSQIEEEQFEKKVQHHENERGQVLKKLEEISIDPSYLSSTASTTEGTRKETSASEQEELKKNAGSLNQDWYVGAAYHIPHQGSIPKWLQSMYRKEQQQLDNEESLDNPSSLTDIHTTKTSVLSFDDIPFEKSVEQIIRILERNQAQNVVVINTSKKSEWIDYMIIAEGRSQKQVYTIADEARRLFKNYQPSDPFLPPNVSIEGRDTDWLTVDLGRIMVHVFEPHSREQYDLDGLWTGFST